ncbi:YciI family protein [Cellulomonas composti]|uniref:YCII-related domain-containing protein n=1 Tax=Cellulomonas composti TaxID=266130 RepID=A0A511J6J7_9CELL|nr:YciI family protein [Cellulomonas composti]GEL93618.1 hypothetical protein CCO02nite_02760 [Cellulomonas composti]
MPHFAVRYTYDLRADARDHFRTEHRAYLAGLADGGALLGSGPFSTGAAGALIVLRARDEEHVKEMLDADPFQREGLVAETEVRVWEIVLGPWSEA